jgi:stress-induced morphogen
MPMDAATIESLIRAGIPEAEVVMTDLAGDGDHYAAKVYSPAFAGKTRLQQHQMVYLTLGDRMGGEIHALSLQTSSDPDFLRNP